MAFWSWQKFVTLMQGVNSPQCGGENQKFYWRGTFLLGEGNLRMSDFDNSNLFQS